MPNPDFKYKRVLIVDDFEMGRFITRKALIELGFTSMDEAEDGIVAIGKINLALGTGQPYAIIFCDWNMPEASGLEVLAAIRSNPEVAETPFIMVTAQTDREYVVRALDAGVTDYIAKPIAAESLAKKLDRILATKKTEN